MSLTKTSVIVFFLSLILLIISDNLIHGFVANKKTEQMTVSFRHGLYADYFSSPSSYYISISNASLSDSVQRFRTGKYGEVLDSVYDKKIYDRSCKYVFIGGSSTETHWVDETRRWVALVGKKIQDNDSNAVAFNFGVGGQNLAQSLNRYNSFINELKPDYVFVMHEANDISKFLKGGYSVAEGSLHSLYDRTKTYDSISSRLKSILGNLLPFSYHQWRKYSNKSYIPARSESLNAFKGMEPQKAAEEYAGRLLALNELVTSHGGTLVLIEYPEVYEEVLLNQSDVVNENVKANIKIGLANNSISERDFIKFLKEFRWHLQTIVQQRDIPQIKTKGFFDVDDFYDAVHFNDSGSLKFAQFMHNELVDFICR